MNPVGMAVDEKTYHQENKTNKLTTPLPFGEGMGERLFLIIHVKVTGSQGLFVSFSLPLQLDRKDN